MILKFRGETNTLGRQEDSVGGVRVAETEKLGWCSLMKEWGKRREDKEETIMAETIQIK